MALPATTNTTLRLKLIVEADFRKTEATNWQEKAAAGELPPLKAGEVVCFVSGNRSQVVFVQAPTDFHTAGGLDAKVYASRRLRLDRGAWNPLMLADYAEQVGLRLDGLKKFKEHYEEQQERKRTGTDD